MLTLASLPHVRPQRWYEKLKSSGALAGGAAATSGIVSRVGAGQAIIAAQYAPPPVDTTAADVVFERITQDKGEPPAPPKTAADGSGLATGVPRGAHLYSLASDQQPIRRFDGRPAARMEPPKRGRPLALGVVECVRARADQPDG